MTNISGAARSKNKIRILFFNSMWGQLPDLPSISLPEDVEFLTGTDQWREMDAVVFHMPELSSNHFIFDHGIKPPGQIWVFWSMECEAHYPWHNHSEIRRLFDVDMTYQLSSHVPVPYFTSSYYKLLRNPPIVKTKFINAMISSQYDKSNRISFLKELMQYVEIDSFGKTLNTMVLPKDEGRATKLSTTANYQFTLALENAIADDYVTEKFFDPLIAGSVPVYLGARNINDFSPGDNCFINANNFSVKELADYLLMLRYDDLLYQRHLDWKGRPFRNEFVLKNDWIGVNPFTRLAIEVRNRLVARGKC
jgi:hypothetical protein